MAASFHVEASLGAEGVGVAHHQERNSSSVSEQVMAATVRELLPLARPPGVTLTSEDVKQVGGSRREWPGRRRPWSIHRH